MKLRPNSTRTVISSALSLLFIFICLALPSETNFDSAQPYIKEANVAVVMSDGVRLATDIYLPQEEGRFPVVLIRTPYKKENMGLLLGEFLAANGYAVVIQDTRGRFGSGGDFIPLVYERKDGLETLDWILKQDWSDGKIGIWGPSYLGYCGLILAMSRHPALKTVINISAVADMNSFLYPGGALHLMAALPWALFAEGKDLRQVNLANLYQHTPLREAPASINVKSGIWEMFTNPEIKKQFQSELSIQDQYEKMDVPLLHLTGLNDWVYRGTLEIYETVQKSRALRKQKPFQKLIIGPWYHDQQWTGKTQVGEEDFGPQAAMDVPGVQALSLFWMDYWLKGVDNGLLNKPAVDIFIMGKNEWTQEKSWPPHDVIYQNWYLQSEKGAASLAGDGKLSLKKKRGDSSDSFVFDPLNPVLTRGGVNFHFFPDELGIKDQRPVEQRKDVLVFTSEPLAKDIEIIGPVKVILYASTEGEDTDFTAKLVEVRPEGYARIIEDGIIRARFRHSRENPELLKPGEVYELTIDLGATAVFIRKGHQIRLEVSSSNFPKYDRNPNTGEDPLAAVEFKKVAQKIFYSARYSSRLVLPVRSARK